LAVLGRNIVLVDALRHLRLWSGRPLANPSHVAFSPLDERLVVKGTSGRLVVLDANDGSTIASPADAKNGEGCGVHFSPCGQFIVDGSWDGTITVRDAVSGRVEERVGASGEMVASLSRCATGHVWLSNHLPKAGSSGHRRPYWTVWRWPLRRVAVFELPEIDIHYSSALSPDGLRIAVRGRNGVAREPQLVVLDASGRTIVSTTAPIGGCSTIARWSPDGTFLGTPEASGFVVRTSVGLVVRWTMASEYPADLSFLPGSDTLALGTWKRTTLLPWPSQLTDREAQT
jgi:WD40 repeat protein